MFILRTYILIGSPFFIVATAVYFYERRLCYTWRGELCARSIGIYPKQSIEDAMQCRRPALTLDDALTMQAPEENPGLYVTPKNLSEDEVAMVLEEVGNWVARYGRPLSDNVRGARMDDLADAGFSNSFIDATQFISDRYEDKRPPKAPWGTGDALRRDKLPPLLRQLDVKAHEHCPSLGELRHVYLEYSPTGEFYVPRKGPHAYDGHEYVIIPLLQDRARGGRVVTFSPSSRSRVSMLRDSLLGSWTTQDLDVYVPNGGFLRVFAAARFRWSWGLRPCHTYAHPANPLPVDDNGRSTLAPSSDRWRLPSLSGEPAAPPPAVVATSRPWWKAIPGFATPPPPPPEPGARTVTDTYAAAAVGATARKAAGGDAAAGRRAAVAASQVPGDPGAIVVLHYEGPVKEGKQRKKTRRWECYAYGAPPGPKTFDWSDGEGCKPPTEEEIKEEGLFFFLARNYFWLAKDPDKYEYL